MDGTITAKTKVTLKKRRNPRSLKIWDSAVMNAAMQHAAEIKDRINDAAIKAGTINLEELGTTTVPTQVLYVLADSFLDAYKVLLSESLVQTGNPKQNPNIH